jgi:outer membrane protein insertion porin family
MVAVIKVVVFLSMSLTVRSVSITGDSLVKEKELRTVMLLREPKFFSKSKFHLNILNGDIDALRSLFMTKGFLEPVITAEYDVDSINRLVDVRIKINEGKQTLVNNISFSGNRFFTSQQLESQIKLKVGLPFNPFGLENEYLRLINQYDQKGYHDARVTAEVTIVDGASIDFNISEGEKVFISDITTEGTHSIDRRRLRKAIGLERETILTNNKIAEARKRLYELDIFSRIRFSEEPDDCGRKLIFRLEPKEPISLAFRIGYSALDGPLITITHKNNNFLHSLRRTTVIGKISFREQSTEVNYRDPITCGHWFENGLGLRIEQRKEIGYKTRRYGGYFIVTPQPISIRYDVERVRVFDVQSDTFINEGTEWLRTLRLSFSRDRRDDPIRPRKGAFISSYTAFSGIFPKATSNFISNEFRYKAFYSRMNFTFGFRFDLGLAKPFSPTNRVPIHSRFFLGGATTVRGYGERAIGPKDKDNNPLGGERYGLLSIEIKKLLFWRFSGVVFMDIGTIELKMDSRKFPLKSGIGSGVRLYTPLGPFRLDYARNLEGSGCFHFAIGEAF